MGDGGDRGALGAAVGVTIGRILANIGLMMSAMFGLGVGGFVGADGSFLANEIRKGGLTTRLTVDQGGSVSIRLDSKSALRVGSTGNTVTASVSSVTGCLCTGG